MAFEIRGKDTRRGVLYTHGNMTYGARLRGRGPFWGARIFKNKNETVFSWSACTFCLEFTDMSACDF